MKWVAIAIVAVAAALTGCSSMEIQSDFDRDADFSGYRTWNWVPEKAPPTGDRRVDDPKVRESLEEIIEAKFLERGYERNTKSPDFYVNYFAALRDELNPTRIDNYYEYTAYTVFVPYWMSTYTTVWETGTMFLDVLDPTTKKLVWRGFAEIEINPQAGPRENVPKIEKAVGKMLKRFPPK